ncbi:MAG: glycoside hydrolase family 36 protein [Balneolales bacterium]
MNTKMFYSSILMFMVGFSMMSCSDSEPVVETPDLRIEFNERLHSRVVSKLQDNEVLLSGFRPTEYITINGEDITDFELMSVESETVRGDLGRGSALILTGESGVIKKTVTVETYQNYPSVAVFNVSYENIGNEPVTVREWVSHNYQMPNNTPETYSHSFWSYQSESTSRRNDWVLPVGEGFSQQNYMGMNNSDYGGGTPVLSLWGPEAGLAIGHLEMVPKLISMPVNMASNDYVDFRILYDKEEELQPGGSVSTFETFVRVQKGDYFGSLIDYRNMMIDKGIEFPEVHPSSYETQWCAWGYEREFTMDQVYGTLPKVDDLHYHWAVLDDGWQTNVGDWDLNPGKYPNGNEDMIEFVNTLHNEGFRSKLWWAPLAMHPESNIYETDPEYLLLDEDLEPVRISWWNSYYMCPAYQPVVDYHTDLVRTIMETWGYHGIKIDGQHLNAAPPCYNPAHNHDRPEESHEAMASFFKAIYDTGTDIVDDALIEICPCGTAYAFHNLPYMTQGVSSDPTSSWQVRHKGRTLKALMGRDTPFFGDHVELSRGREDFASQVGIGAIIGTKFTWPVGAGPNPATDLTPEREEIWSKWSEIYEEKRLAEGQYIGELYDIGFDRPETHVVQKDNRLYFGIYADQNPGKDPNDAGTYQGAVELRGLQDGVTYRVSDYENGVDFGTVIGPVASVEASFTNHLLLEAVPQ